MMMSDSYNHVFGQCVHPLNRALISGGSSGGEGEDEGCGGGEGEEVEVGDGAKGVFIILGGFHQF